jgi:hypothetical protein
VPAVKVRPAIVRVCPAANALKVVAAVSVRIAPPSVVTIVGAIVGEETVAVKLVTLVFVEELVKVTAVVEVGPLAQPATTPEVKLPPLRFPKTLVGVRLKIVWL